MLCRSISPKTLKSPVYFHCNGVNLTFRWISLLRICISVRWGRVLSSGNQCYYLKNWKYVVFHMCVKPDLYTLNICWHVLLFHPQLNFSCGLNHFFIAARNLSHLQKRFKWCRHDSKWIRIKFRERRVQSAWWELAFELNGITLVDWHLAQWISLADWPEYSISYLTVMPLFRKMHEPGTLSENEIWTPVHLWNLHVSR